MRQLFKHNLSEIFSQKNSSIQSEKEIIEMIIINPLSLREVRNQTHAICIGAVKESGYLVQFVRNQTEAICLCAVKQNGYALRYVHNQTESICIEAVKKNGYALQYVHNQTESICMEAVKQDGLALKYVHNQTESICLCAVKQNGLALHYVRRQTNSICIEAVKQNGNSLEYVRRQTNAICIEAVKRDPSILVIYHIQHLTEDLFLDILKNLKISGQAIKFLAENIQYPSLTTIDKTLAINASLSKYFDKLYVSELVSSYDKYNIVMDNIGQHTTDLLYRPNNIGGLLFGECPKLLFLT